jgi:hypothetical protein
VLLRVALAEALAAPLGEADCDPVPLGDAKGLREVLGDPDGEDDAGAELEALEEGAPLAEPLELPHADAVVDPEAQMEPVAAGLSVGQCDAVPDRVSEGVADAQREGLRVPQPDAVIDGEPLKDAEGDPEALRVPLGLPLPLPLA